jgi:hypothetical protein
MPFHLKLLFKDLKLLNCNRMGPISPISQSHHIEKKIIQWLLLHLRHMTIITITQENNQIKRVAQSMQIWLPNIRQANLMKSIKLLQLLLCKVFRILNELWPNYRVLHHLSIRQRTHRWEISLNHRFNHLHRITNSHKFLEIQIMKVSLAVANRLQQKVVASNFCKTFNSLTILDRLTWAATMGPVHQSMKSYKLTKEKRKSLIRS